MKLWIHGAKNMKIKLGTKAETLIKFKSVLKDIFVADIFIVTFKEWTSQQQDTLSKINEQFGTNLLIIRSSSFDEDCENKS